MNYGRVALVYDRIAQLVFGSKLLCAQHVGLDYCHYPLTIIGGGTGLILQYIPEKKQVEFIEQSLQMVKIARKRDTAAFVSFKAEPFTCLKQLTGCYLLPFVMDTWSDRQILDFFRQLSPQSEAIIVDFVPPQKPYHRLLARVMIWALKLTAGHPRTNIPDILKLSKVAGCHHSILFEDMQGFIRVIKASK